MPDRVAQLKTAFEGPGYPGHDEEPGERFKFRVRRAIEAGKLEPGTAFSVDELAEALGVGTLSTGRRSPMAAGVVKALVAEGLLLSDGVDGVCVTVAPDRDTPPGISPVAREIVALLRERDVPAGGSFTRREVLSWAPGLKLESTTTALRQLHGTGVLHGRLSDNVVDARFGPRPDWMDRIGQRVELVRAALRADGIGPATRGVVEGFRACATDPTFQRAPGGRRLPAMLAWLITEVPIGEGAVLPGTKAMDAGLTAAGLPTTLANNLTVAYTTLAETGYVDRFDSGRCVRVAGRPRTADPLDLYVGTWPTRLESTLARVARV